MGSKRRAARTAARSGHRTPTDPLPAANRMVVEAERLTAREILNEGRTIEKAVEVAGNAASYAEHVVEQFAEATGGKPPLACGKGCSHCCHVRIEAEIPEVIQIASYLKAKFSPEEQAAARERIESHLSTTKDFSGEDWFTCRLACPMLVDGECSIYPVRPLMCRGWNSASAEACKAYLDDPTSRGVTEIYAPQLTICAHVLEGMEQGTRSLGLESYVVEMVAAVHIALDDPEAADRWLAGEVVFSEARRGMDTEDFRAAQRNAQEINRRATAKRLLQIGLPGSL